jgi:hypothetical protein
MLMPARRVRIAARRGVANRRGVAAMEFAMVAPIMVLMIWAVYDIARALLAWEETNHAAQAIAQAAEKMSVTGTTNLTTGKPITSLTSQQMQDAMTSIYAEMPWLNLGNAGGSFPGAYGVTLSGIQFWPLCPANNTGTCPTQAPAVKWSTYLAPAEGGPHLVAPLPTASTVPWRLCSPSPLPVSQFPNNATQLQYMIDPNLNTTAPQLVVIPQVVADVYYVFQPTFPLLTKSITFYASATFPAPLGGDDQLITFAPGAAFDTYVETCPDP